MTKSIFIDGAAGTTGLEIADRLAGRAEFSLISLDDAKRKDMAAKREALNDADFVILCLPDDAAKEAVAMTTSASTRIIDASTAYRIDPDWAYGFAEMDRAQSDRIAAARFVANPGCWPQGLIAAAGVVAAAAVMALTAKGRQVREFASESLFELRKVVWPTTQETRKITGVILVVVVIVSLILSAFDFVISWLIRLLLG